MYPFRHKAFYHKVILPLVLLFGFIFNAGAQVIMSFEPVINGQTLEGLQRVRMINSTAEMLNGSLKITVRDGAGGIVMNVITPVFRIHPGANELDPGIFSSSKIRFGNSSAVQVLGQTGRFPEGNFQYCFEFDAQPSKPASPIIPYESCYNAYIQPYTPLLLINPMNQAVICNPRPDFSWQPPFPAGNDMRYRIIVTEIKNGQQAADAIVNNLPLINKAELHFNHLVYPQNIPALTEGQKYAWQVTAYVNRTIVQKSEIWVFTYDCAHAKTDSVFDSYREVKTEIDGNYYIADRVLKFSLNNPYKAGKLDYTIIDLADPLKPIKRLPRINIQTGLNKIDLRLNNNKDFINGHTYLMRIDNIANHQVILRFTYKE